MTSIDLNSDLGESFGRWVLGDDAAMVPLISSANIACGFHAGDPTTLRRTCEQAAAAGCWSAPRSPLEPDPGPRPAGSGTIRGGSGRPAGDKHRTDGQCAESGAKEGPADRPVSAPSDPADWLHYRGRQ